MRRRKSRFRAGSAPLPTPVCPLAPHIPLASVDTIGAYIVMSPLARVSPYVIRPNPTLIFVANLPPNATRETAAKTLGPGGFFLVCFDGDNLSVGESTIVLPGEERSKTVIALQNGERKRRVAEAKTASEKQAKETAFSTQLHSDEEELVRLLAEIHRFVVQTRFEVASVTETQNSAFQKALTDSERGISLLVGRLRARPKDAWSTLFPLIVGGTALAAMVYYALVGKPAAGVGAGKTP